MIRRLAGGGQCPLRHPLLLASGQGRRVGYDVALGWLVAFSVGARLIAVSILFAVRHTGKPVARSETEP